jgi:hypothetical protein
LLAGVGAVLALGFALMLVDASSGDWPGWDEGWALVAFPVGVPFAVSIGVGASVDDGVDWRLVGLTTLAVWSWGAILFVAWFLAS